MGKTRRNAKFQIVRGAIVAADWDDDDRVVAVSIETDEEELFIDPYGKGEALLDYVDEYVEIRGVVHNDDGEYSISVHGFRVIEGDDDVEEEEEEASRRLRLVEDEDFEDFEE